MGKRGVEQSGVVHAELGARARAAAEAVHPSAASKARGGQASMEIHLGDGRFMRVLGDVDESNVEKLLRAMGWTSSDIAVRMSAEVSRMAEVTAEVTNELRHAAELKNVRRLSAEIERVAEVTAEVTAELGSVAEWSAEQGNERGAERGNERGAERGNERGAERGNERGAERGNEQSARRARKPAAKRAKKPAAKKAAAKKPAAKKAAAKKPAAKKTPKRATRRGARTA